MVGKVAGDCETLSWNFQTKVWSESKGRAFCWHKSQTMDKLDCSDEDFYLKVAVAQYELDPTAEAAFAIGKAYYKRKEYGQSNKYFKEVADGTEDQDMLFDSYQFLGAGMLSLGQAQSAKSYALKMLSDKRTIRRSLS